MGVVLLEPGTKRVPRHLLGLRVDHRPTVTTACEIRGDVVAGRLDIVTVTADPERG